MQWEGNVVRALDAPSDYPIPGQRIHWVCRQGIFRHLLDQPLEVVTSTRLRSALSQGFVRYDETYSLDGTQPTSLRVDLEVRVALPLIGGLIDRLRVREDARSAFASSLEGLKRYCEANPG